VVGWVVVSGVVASFGAAGFSWLVVSLAGSSFDWGWAGGVVSYVLFSGACVVLTLLETSYEGHMVDALASRADEGRWSLR
jgi:hypothetical protein